MFPHERSLVKRMEGRPFVLLGINADETREELQQTIQAKNLNWRDWWDEDGNISEKWDVEAFPTLFLLDHHGVVRQRFVGAPNEGVLEQAIDRLVEEAEKESRQPAAP
jgi:peroxiredoxin